MMLFLLFTTPSLAQEPACEALSPEELEGRVSVARQALFYEEMDTFAAVAQELEARIPCLTAVPAPEVWSRHLVSLSVAAFAENGDWQAPLASALRVHPTVDRGVGANHPIAQWSPPPEDTAVQKPVPAGATLYLDGRKVSFVPELRGPHLVQVERDGQLRSALLVDEAVPADWLPSSSVVGSSGAGPEADRNHSGWLALYAALGWGTGMQRVDDPGDYLGDVRASVPYAGLATIGQAAVAGPIGVAWTGSAQLTGSPLAADAGLGVGAVTPSVAVTAGVSLRTDAVRVSDADASFLAAAPSVMAGVATGPLDGRLQVALGPSLTQLGADAGVRLGSGGMAPRVGIRGGWAAAHLVQEDSGREVDVAEWAAVATFGLRIGG